MSVQVRFAVGPSEGSPVLLVHGGAGARSTPPSGDSERGYQSGLAAALAAGAGVLSQGGTALDAVCAAVTALEDDPLFNAGRGASLTAAGTAELDAAVMTGDGRAGAIAASRYIRNPILGARAVMERTPHVLIAGPSAELAAEWNLDTVSPDYFITDHRRAQLATMLANCNAGPRHGTVGAVALDSAGHVACATSTGGMAGQAVGRVGDTPLIGSGSFAADDSVAVSCTGDGEAYIRGVVAHDIASRIRYLGQGLEDAVQATYERTIERVGATGGTIAVTPLREAVIMHNSGGMFAGYWDSATCRTFT
ncbi:MAG: isoaspartyl peptidase/L-asparaginase [Nakamurella sp.]